MIALSDERLLAKFNANPPASPISIARCQADLGLPLPTDYVRFLRKMNGGEGFLGENAYLVLWRAEELAEMNAGYKIPESPRELCLFGSNGGGEAFAFDTRTVPPPIVVVPFVGLDWNDAILIATSFREFLETLFTSGIPFCTGRRYGENIDSDSTS
jgi:SMI1 / KNR4 family (SUKH-1)